MAGNRSKLQNCIGRKGRIVSMVVQAVFICGFLVAGAILLATNSRRPKQQIHLPKMGKDDQVLLGAVVSGSLSPLMIATFYQEVRAVIQVIKEDTVIPTKPSGTVEADISFSNQRWQNLLRLNTTATGVLSKLDQWHKNNKKCNCEVKGTMKLRSSVQLVWSALFQWTIVSVLDLRNFKNSLLRNGQGYYLYIGHDDTPAGRAESPSLQKYKLGPVSDLRNYDSKGLNEQNYRAIKISEFHYAEVDFDGYWPSYCTFVETKYGYSNDSKFAHTRSKWLAQLQRQLNAARLANRQTTCPLECPVVWVFSNNEAKKYFDDMLRDNLQKLNYKNIFSFCVFPEEIKFLQNII